MTHPVSHLLIYLKPSRTIFYFVVYSSTLWAGWLGLGRPVWSGGGDSRYLPGGRGVWGSGRWLLRAGAWVPPEILRMPNTAAAHHRTLPAGDRRPAGRSPCGACGRHRERGDF